MSEATEKKSPGRPRVGVTEENAYWVRKWVTRQIFEYTLEKHLLDPAQEYTAKKEFDEIESKNYLQKTHLEMDEWVKKWLSPYGWKCCQAAIRQRNHNRIGKRRITIKKINIRQTLTKINDFIEKSGETVGWRIQYLTAQNTQIEGTLDLLLDFASQNPTEFTTYIFEQFEAHQGQNARE